MVKKKKTETSCDFCNNLVYDDEIESYVCDVIMDEDDYARFLSSSRTYCPYYQSNDVQSCTRHCSDNTDNMFCLNILSVLSEQ